MCLYGCVDADPEEMVELAVRDGTDDPGRACHVPLAAHGLAVLGDCVFLSVIEIIVQRHSRVRFEGRYISWSQVKPIVF